jgi:amidase
MEHRFAPTVYYTTLGSHPPALGIESGDTIITTTVDARGADAEERTVAGRPNPQTGPFYVAGAEPGDALEVRFERVWPNRRHGWSGSALMPNVVDPAYVPESPMRMASDWDVDMQRGIAMLTHPETALGRWTLPVNTMVGCFGVAPADGQAISAATSGPHGGNMDYRGFGPGVIAYLPVFVPGALFFLGDGHAIQADGEILGAGIDISLDVQFRLRVIKGWALGWPRGEDETCIFTAGNARPLDQALQHATTEMLRWLQADYGLDPYAAHILLGQTVRYDVGNCIDPAYTMICKVPKSVLPARVQARA